MLEACRTCLRLINIDNSSFYEIEADDMQISAESCRYKLLSIVPEMALNITPKSMLCAECHWSLEALFEFKKQCLKTENIISQYFQTKLDLDIKNLDLKDVSAFNAADIKISEDESVEVLVQDEAAKEEVKLSDTAIVKHEVDDFSLESVEVAQPKNTVPHSSADIKIGEEVVEASVEDIAVKEEVELSDTVITNVKHEVDDFLSDSAEVARPKNAVPGLNFMCEYCKKCCKNFSSLKIHLRTHTGEKPHRCEICDRRFLKKHHLTAHLRTHTGEKPYHCETCNRSFAWQTNLIIHQRNHTGERPYICTVCGKGFSTNTKVTVHMRSHTGEKPYHCEICDHRFTIKHELTIHLRRHFGEKPHRCEMCDRSFAKKSELTFHLRIHTGEQPYVCTICGKGFNSNSKLTIHMRSHTGEKPYHCEICDHRFQTKRHLTDHLSTHTGEKPYRCETCDRSFTRKSYLTTHLHVHSGERPFVCTVCGKGYSSSFYLKRHTRTHNTEQPHQCEKNSSPVIHHKKRSLSKSFRCDHCKELFWHKQHLEKHIRKVHKDVDVNMVFIKCENTSFTDQEETQNSIASPSGQ